MNPSIIYIDIESLLDLRQGYLSTVVENYKDLSDYLLSDEYNYRTTDDLKFTEPGAYREAMKNPPKTFLEGSIITRMLISLKNKVDSIEHRNTYYNESTEPQILLNVYPFVLSEEENNHIRNLLFVKLKSECKINVVSLPLSDLTPIYMKTANIVSAFIYDFNTWMDLHTESLKNIGLPDTILYFPYILEKEPSEEEMRKFNKLGFKDPGSYLEYLMSPVACINFLPVLFYSNIITALKLLEQYETQLKKEFIDEEAEKKYGDILSKIQVP